MAKWEKVEDKNLQHIWVCPECKDDTSVGPEWYQNNGTPMCVRDLCDCDMEYSHTEIKT